jgi:uncharacterized membrane protein
MKKLSSTVITGMALISSSTLTALPASAEGFNIGFFNACQSKSLNVAVSFKDFSGSWADEGMYNFSPGERARLTGIQTTNRVFYYYAEATDGSLTWRSEDQPTLTVNGSSYKPRKETANVATGNYYVTLTCPGETALSAPESSSEVVGESYEDMGGGWGGAKATLYRNGLLVIEGQAVSNANNSGTRTTVNVVGVDRKGNAIFVSQPLDIPTACGRWDPSCPSDRRGRSDQNISPEVAKYVSRLNIHISDRQGPNIYNNFVRNIREACSSYDNLPQGVRAAVASQGGFSGCN